MQQVRFWNEEYETLPREAIRRIQLIRLQKQIAYVYENSPFYRRKFDKAGLEPGDIKSLEDVSKIPFTVKEELRDSQAAHPPWGDFLCIPPEDGVRVFQTSGTTGEPLRVLLSRNDWSRHYYEQFMHFHARLRHHPGGHSCSCPSATDCTSPGGASRPPWNRPG